MNTVNLDLMVDAEPETGPGENAKTPGNATGDTIELDSDIEVTPIVMSADGTVTPALPAPGTPTRNNEGPTSDSDPGGVQV